jgi:hypothetical protein
LVKFRENSIDELLSPLRRAQELTVVPRSSSEKAHILFAEVRAQAYHSHQVIAVVVAEKQQRLQGGLICGLHGERPFTLVENLGPLHLQDQVIPAPLKRRILRNFPE